MYGALPFGQMRGVLVGRQAARRGVRKASPCSERDTKKVRDYYIAPIFYKMKIKEGLVDV